jgi:protein CrcB
VRLVLICVGGALGTGLRYLISGTMVQWLGPGFPSGTLVVNVLGSFVTGVIQEVGTTSLLVPNTTRLVLTVGMMGGLTTYSTFSYETVRLMEAERVAPGLGQPHRDLDVLPDVLLPGDRRRAVDGRAQGRRVTCAHSRASRSSCGSSSASPTSGSTGPLYMALIQLFRRNGLAGATVLKGVAGFGARSVVHTASLLRLSADLPLVIEVVDSQEQLDKLLLRIDGMITGGLITMEKVRGIRYEATRG